MSNIEVIKQFELAGFTRKQAEVQVKTMDDFKKGLATTKDIESVKKDVGHLHHEMNYRLETMDTKFETKLDAMNTKFETKLDLLNVKLDNYPFKTAIYTAGVFLTMLGLAKYLPLLSLWLFN